MPSSICLVSGQAGLAAPLLHRRPNPPKRSTRKGLRSILRVENVVAGRQVHYALDVKYKVKSVVHAGVVSEEVGFGVVGSQQEDCEEAEHGQ